ncbi:MAG: CYTH domain-containing protein [Spirochaetales bacterium]
MGTEIERKFLPLPGWRQAHGLSQGVLYRQGYLNSTPGRTVRIRLVSDPVVGATGYVTIKGPVTGLVRSEYEYEIPATDAAELLDTLCERPLIEKTRYRVPQDSLVWEIDEFHGENAPLVVAEIELDSAGQGFERPAWLGREVSDDPRYFNSRLAKTPYSAWKDAP